MDREAGQRTEDSGRREDIIERVPLGWPLVPPPHSLASNTMTPHAQFFLPLSIRPLSPSVCVRFFFFSPFRHPGEHTSFTPVVGTWVQ